MALAIYRKYRPKVLADIIGQDLVVEVLGNAAKANKLSHAYLFHGPRGTGKTTAARLLAKIANCETRDKNETFCKKGEPCNKCLPCEEIDAGRALDVVELDAASNRGIDEIRNLKEGIRLSPTSHKNKVFIIDEAHQLTKDAFGALLKTLEEPPAHAIFILATTEDDKIPSTISSRTQRFHFRKVPIQLIFEKLQKISRTEKLSITDDALELIASASEGSFRDAESLLEQVASIGGNMDLATVERILGKVGLMRTSTLTGYLIEGNLAASLEYLAEINEAGFNLVQLTKDLIHYFRRILTYKFDSKIEAYLNRELTKDELDTIKGHATNIKDVDKTIELVKALIRAYSQMRYSPFAIVPLEIAIIEQLK